MNIEQLKSNPKNPRTIDDESLLKLANSIKEFPQMMEMRPIVIDGDIVIGGNQRFQALKLLNYEEIPDKWIFDASHLNQAQKNEFAIKDNLSSGKWDWEMLNTEWGELEKLKEWGLYVPEFSSDIELGDFFEKDTTNSEGKNRIVLEYTDADYKKINEAFEQHEGKREDVIMKLLGL